MIQLEGVSKVYRTGEVESAERWTVLT